MQQTLNILAKVFSTYVEVIPVYPTITEKQRGILHVCGGDPKIPKGLHYYCGYSPRMWR